MAVDEVACADVDGRLGHPADGIERACQGRALRGRVAAWVGRIGDQPFRCDVGVAYDAVVPAWGGRADPRAGRLTRVRRRCDVRGRTQKRTGLDGQRDRGAVLGEDR